MNLMEFRVWNNLDKKWIEHDAYIDEYGGIWQKRKGEMSHLNHEHYFANQYTGRKDVNDKKLFENDILKCCVVEVPFHPHNGGIFYGIVEWLDDPCACWVINFCNEGMRLTFSNLIEKYCADFEVIGNTYENEDLLNDTGKSKVDCEICGCPVSNSGVCQSCYGKEVL